MASHITLLYSVDRPGESGIKVFKFPPNRHLDDVCAEVLAESGTCIEPEHLLDVMARTRAAGARVDADRIAEVLAAVMAQRLHENAPAAKKA